MRFFTALLLLLCLVILNSCDSKGGPQLHMLTWSGYLQPEVIEDFEEKYQCRVVIDTYDSNESMYAKLTLGASHYDLIFPSNYFLELLNERGMLQTVDYSKIPNGKNLDPRYMKKLGPDLQALGVPYTTTSAGIGYRKDKMQNPIDSWGVFGNPAYKGRMTMLNDMRETLGAALLFLGYKANTTDPAEITEAADLLITWKKNLAKFENEQYKSGIASSEYLVIQGYNGDILQVIRENPKIGFVYPKEGITITFDFIAIPKASQNPELSYLFINYLLEPDVAYEHMEFSSFFSPNTAAYPLLPEELRENPAFFMPESVLEKAELIRYLGVQGKLYNRAWDRVKNE